MTPAVAKNRKQKDWDKPRRVDAYYSTWCTRAVESERTKDQLITCYSFIKKIKTKPLQPSSFSGLRIHACLHARLKMVKDVKVQEQGGEYSVKDYHDPPPVPLIDMEELIQWSVYRAKDACKQKKRKVSSTIKHHYYYQY